MSEQTSSRRPICVQCGTLGTRWYQPIIGTENFCSIPCVQAYVGAHQHSGETAQAIHTDACRHYTPDGATADEQRNAPLRYCSCGHIEHAGACLPRIGVTCYCSTFRETRSNMTLQRNDTHTQCAQCYIAIAPVSTPRCERCLGCANGSHCELPAPVLCAVCAGAN
jgi:hypothetical protein